MEGSLRSAVYVMHRILDRKDGNTFEFMPWLLVDDRAADRAALRVEEKYLVSLRKWAAHLDSYNMTTLYMYAP